MRTVFREFQQQQRFEKEGYVVLNLLNSKKVNSLLEEFSHKEAMLARQAFGTSTMSAHNDSKLEISKRLEACFIPKINDILYEYKWLFGSFIYKYPSPDANQGLVTMHQDATIVDESKYHGINIFCSLTESNETSGALQVIPGSHKLNPCARGFGQPFPYKEWEPLLKPRMKRIDLNPGQAIIYTTKLFHYSQPNMSNCPRIIAAGITGPEESQLRYYHVDRYKGSTLEIFEVDAMHYLTAPFFSRPDESKYTKIGEITAQWNPLSEDEIEQKLAAVE